jgi:hypothetical protein
LPLLPLGAQSVPPGKHKTLLPTGSAFEAKMAGEIPLSAPELLNIEAKFGFKKFCQLLGKFMKLTNWTCLDLLPACYIMLGSTVSVIAWVDSF